MKDNAIAIAILVLVVGLVLYAGWTLSDIISDTSELIEIRIK